MLRRNKRRPCNATSAKPVHSLYGSSCATCKSSCGSPCATCGASHFIDIYLLTYLLTSLLTFLLACFIASLLEHLAPQIWCISRVEETVANIGSSCTGGWTTRGRLHYGCARLRRSGSARRRRGTRPGSARRCRSGSARRCRSDLGRVVVEQGPAIVIGRGVVAAGVRGNKRRPRGIGKSPRWPAALL